jgi:pimeloyl-ACP methyl ester carboxylesterase
MSFDELQDDVLKLLDARGAREAHVVGMSGGALLGLKLVLDHPERVRSLTMISGAAYIDQHTRSVADRWEETLAKEGPDAFALRVLKDLYYPDWIEAHLDYADMVRALAPKTDFGPAWKWSRAMQAFDERNRIASVRRPTLIIQAMDDQMIDASHGRILRQTIPGAQIRILAQTGHMVPIERPDETAAAVREFLSSVESASPSGHSA